MRQGGLYGPEDGNLDLSREVRYLCGVRKKGSALERVRQTPEGRWSMRVG